MGAWKGDWPLDTKLPLVGGHEGVGVGIGENVTGWELGDYAGIKWLNGSCLNCEFCEQGAEPNCPQADLSGYTHDGSFEQYATADAVQAARIPKNADLAKAAPILCAGVTVYKALKTAQLRLVNGFVFLVLVVDWVHWLFNTLLPWVTELLVSMEVLKRVNTLNL